MCSVFAGVELGPPIEVFALTKSFNDDTDSKKVNLGVGAYRTEEGKPWVLPIVRETEKMMSCDMSLNHEYLPILGLESFYTASVSMLLGADNPVLLEQKAFGIQTLSGTGALRVGAEFLATVLKKETFYYSQPTWENHHLVFMNAGFTDPHKYRYWNDKDRNLDITGFLTDLKQAPAGSVIILHACAHNPTGCDPTREQWKEIADVMQERNLFPFFDSAYQGFATGDLDRDAWAIRHFVSRGFEMLCAQSFAKNFGLYNERVGCLAVVTSDPSVVPKIKSQLTIVVRGMYSNPPNHGARIVSTVLNNPDLTAKWKECIKTMSSRIMNMRTALSGELKRLGTPGTWDHISKQIGMFSFTGLTKQQVENMVKKHHCYLLSSGRINMCAVNSSNVEHIAQAIHESVSSFPSDGAGGSDKCSCADDCSKL